MIFSLEINQTGVGFSATISQGVERITGTECMTIKESLIDAIDLAIDCSMITQKSMMIHMARGNGVICGMCKLNKLEKCSFKLNYECYERKDL